MIFARFKGRRRAIAKLRLVRKIFAAIGFHCLVLEVHLIFKSSSFQHLREISEHSVISQQVETLLFKADTLTTHGTMRQWKNEIIVPGWVQSMADDEVPPAASKRKQRAYI